MSIEHSPDHQPLPPEDDPFSLEFITRHAKELTLRDGFHAPTLFAIGSASALAGELEEMPDTHVARVRLMHRTGQFLGEQDALGALQQVIFITEAWMHVFPQDAETGRPARDASRLEVLCIARLTLLDLQEYDLGDEDGEERADSPLLRAFASGYRTARARRNN